MTTGVNGDAAGLTFTILHTNDLHSNLIGVGPASEYTPSSINDDSTLGGIERIATLIADRKRARSSEGPVLVLDIGDLTIGTPFGAAAQETGAELRCLFLAGYDAMTLGNHDFDYGPAALAEMISAAFKANQLIPIVASNTNFEAEHDSLDGLKDLAARGAIRSHLVIERDGIRFGLFGMMGLDSIQWTINPGAVTFLNPVETARTMARQLKAEGADIVICMSHGGMQEPAEGVITEGDDIDLANAVPEIDVIIGGHTHTFVRTPTIVNGTPIVQAGCNGQALGELVIRMQGHDRHVLSYELHSVDDSIPGDLALKEAMTQFQADTSRILFEPRGLQMYEPIAVIDRDWSNSFLDLAASLPLGNLTADALRAATGSDVALNAAGMVRAGLQRGESGVQTTYDIFLIAPLGIGVNDQSAGGSLVRAFFTGNELKSCLEFMLQGNPNLPGQYFPRVSGMRFKFDPTRSLFDKVLEIELGDLDRGYQKIDISESAEARYSLVCNLFLGLSIASITAKSGGMLSVVPKKRDGTPMQSRVDALPAYRYGQRVMVEKGEIDRDGIVAADDASSRGEIKEWQAIVNYLKSLPVKNDAGVTVLEMSVRSLEERAINVRA